MLYTSSKTAGVRYEEDDAKWKPKVRARVKHEAFPKMAEMAEWKSFEDLSFADHMMAWSRVDHLMTLGTDVVGELHALMHDPIGWDSNLPREDLVVAQGRRAVEAATGMELEELDAAWVEYVEKRYPKR